MKIISNNGDLRKNLIRLINDYPNIAFATAWASANTAVFKKLLDNKEKIINAVIGTHFYQTHPDVLDYFIGSKSVKFILQPDGVFHPKIYLFWCHNNWEVIIGSPNLTSGALTNNSEISILISNKDGQPSMINEIYHLINEYWNDAHTILQDESSNYRNIWLTKNKDLRKISDNFGSHKASKPSAHSKVMSMNWREFLMEIKKDPFHSFEKRIDLLYDIEIHFQKHNKFNDIELDFRKGIAGLPSKQVTHWEWFGSMRGAGTFAGLINSSTEAFSSALDAIPLRGEIRREHYDRFIELYLKPYNGKRDGIATATRLLAMKRPDVFLCVDKQNLQKLASDIGLKSPATIKYERYWDEVVERIQQAPWWQSSEPADPLEKKAWRFRAAMLDAIFYEEKR